MEKEFRDPLDGLGCMKLLVWAIAFVVVSITAWAQFTVVETGVFAEGSVVPSGSVRKLDNLEGGVVGKILKKPGDAVQAGEVVVELEKTIAQSDADALDAKIAGLKGKVGMLTAEADGKRMLDAGGEYAAVMRDDLAAIDAKIAGYDHDIAQATAEAASNRARLAALKEAEAAQAEIASSYGGGGQLAQVGKAREERQKLLTIRADEAPLAGQIESAVARAASAASKRESDLAGWRADRRTQAAAARAELEGLMANRTAADRVSRTAIRSPIDGIIQDIHVHGGDTLPPNGTVATVVPSSEGLIILAKIRPEDIRGIQVGDRTYESFSAFDISRYGTLSGTLVSLSPDTDRDEDDRNSAKSFIGRIVTEKNEIGGFAVKPGMTVRSTITTGSRTVLSYLTRPVRDFGMRVGREP